MLSTEFCDLPTVDLAGQSDVGDEHVRHPPPAPGERLLPVGGLDNLVACFRKASTTNSRMRASSSTTRTRTEIFSTKVRGSEICNAHVPLSPRDAE